MNERNLLLVLILIFLLGIMFGVLATKDVFKCKKEVIVKECIKKQDTIPVTVTFFHPVKEQCGKNTHLCKDGFVIKNEDIIHERIAGVSRDLLYEYRLKLGDTILLINSGLYDGKYIIRTIGNEKIRKRLDILLPVGQRATRIDNCKIIYKY